MIPYEKYQAEKSPYDYREKLSHVKMRKHAQVVQSVLNSMSDEFARTHADSIYHPLLDLLEQLENDQLELQNKLLTN